MVKRRGDKRPPLPGGGAAQRLQMFEEARDPAASPGRKQSPRSAAKRSAAQKAGGDKDAKQKGKDP